MAGKSAQETTEKQAVAKEEEFVAGTETEEQFEETLFLLAAWKKAGIVHTTIRPGGRVLFDLPDEIGELLDTQLPRGLSHENILAILRQEVPALLGAALSKDPKRWLARVLPDGLEERIDQMTERIKKVNETLVTKSIQERVLLQRTTPLHVFDDLTWTRASYQVDNPDGSRFDVPHAAVELNFAKPRSGQAIMFVSPDSEELSFRRRDDIAVTLALHRDDIRDLIDRLERIEREMSE